jgi:hypothetical protein
MALVCAWVLAGSWLLVGKVVVKRETLGRQWHQQTADPYL